MIRATFKTRPVRALGWDLESRPSAFWYDGQTTAEITAFGWKWVGESDVHALLLRGDGRYQRSADGRTVSASRAFEVFRAELCRADLIFGHNIRRFDLPLLNAGLLRLRLPPLPALLTTDTLRDYPKRKDMSASLENLAVMYGLDDAGGKKHMSIADWEKANRLSPDGVAAAHERVVSDVLLQERLRDKLLELGLLKQPRRWEP